MAELRRQRKSREFAVLGTCGLLLILSRILRPCAAQTVEVKVVLIT